MGYKEEYMHWLSSNYFDDDTKLELRSIKDDEKEIEDRFYKNLKFGTGGMRGVLGAGTNRMNIYTISKATQGLANYILEYGDRGKQKGVAIAYDNRNMSKEFAQITALCLNANGICSYVFDSLRPTPELSFAVRKLGCIAGVVITASHNPPEYNGYKVYWEDGSQIVAPHDKNIMKHVTEVESYERVKRISLEEAKKIGLYHVIASEVDEAYYQELIKQTIHGELIPKAADDIKIVYTPLHGTGNIPVKEVLKRLGFKKVYTVKEQEVPDGDFSTVLSPNPEESSSFEMALALAKKVDADVIMATDPDADRLGIFVKDNTGVWKDTVMEDSTTYPYVRFNANMTGALMAEYVCREHQLVGDLPSNGAICNTIVSTKLTQAIAKHYGMKYIETLTGFKYIGEQIKLFEEQNTYKFVYGMEESFGCLVGDYTRDKDACGAVVLLCEMAAYYKLQGKTLCDGMEEVYQKYGYYMEDASSITLKGKDGADKIAKMMEEFRNSNMTDIAGNKILAVRDYQTGKRVLLENGEIETVDLPKSNVVYFELERNGWVAVRPSGNEPKIKFYFGVCEEKLQLASEVIMMLKREFLVDK